MLYENVIQGNKISLRMLSIEDCKQYYLDWLNDEEVNRYLETRWHEQSIPAIKDFVKSIRESNHSYLFAIIYNEKHVGNIKIGPIHPIYKNADVGYFIGDKNAWGKGIATEAVKLVTDFGFKILKLHRLQAGTFEQNIGSQKVLLNSGYKKEVTYHEKYFLKKELGYCDVYEYCILKSDWEKLRGEIK